MKMGGPSAWWLGGGLKIPHSMKLVCHEMLPRASDFAGSRAHGNKPLGAMKR